jgi:hypothetical protein
MVDTMLFDLIFVTERDRLIQMKYHHADVSQMRFPRIYLGNIGDVVSLDISCFPFNCSDVSGKHR